MTNQKIDANQIRDKIDQLYAQTHKLPSVRELRTALGNLGSTTVLTRELRLKRSSMQDSEINQDNPEALDQSLATVLADTTQTLKQAFATAVQKVREQCEEKACRSIEFERRQTDEIAHENELLNQRLDELRQAYKQQAENLNATLVTVGQLQEYKTAAQEQIRELKAKVESLQMKNVVRDTKPQPRKTRKTKKKTSNETPNET